MREDEEEEEEEGKVCVRERERKDGRGSPVHLATSTRFWKYLCHKREESLQHPSLSLSLERTTQQQNEKNRNKKI